MWSIVPALLGVFLLQPAAAVAADRYVGSGGDLQAAINSAVAGDRILLEPGATFIGNYRLPVHAGATYITIRSAANDAALPGPTTRITPGDAVNLPKIKSPNTQPAIETVAGTAYWRLETLELLSTQLGFYDILAFGDATSRQSTDASVPHHLVADRLYIHGDPLNGQKRAIALNSASTTISNCYISDIKAIGQDSQALGGWNGPGPFTIVNNYLEAAGEIILFGGSAPSIANLVPSDIVLRGNTITRPLRWREPIMPPPGNVQGTASTGGGLSAGRYGYKVVARRPAYDTVAVSNASAQVVVTLGAAGRVALNWDPVAGATDYLVYGRTADNQNAYWITSSTTFVDDGSRQATSGTPEHGTMWQVKNLIEFKNARRVLATNNVFQHNWAEAQTGEIGRAHV